MEDTRVYHVMLATMMHMRSYTSADNAPGSCICRSMMRAIGVTNAVVSSAVGLASSTSVLLARTLTNGAMMRLATSSALRRVVFCLGDDLITLPAMFLIN